MAEDFIRSVAGTEDVLPDGWAGWRRLDAAARRLFELYGYGEVRTPVIEDARLFEKGTGATTDVVEKEMYTIPSGDEGAIALRPEGTPPVVRAYLEHNLHKQLPFRKLYYVGPMFRHERPQKGRLRQFYQLGVEAIGSDSPLLDAETVLLAVEVFRAVGLRGFRVCLNTIGCADCRPPFRDRLRSILSTRAGDLCGDCRQRIERNVLRVYDCKNEGCRRIVDALPVMAGHLCTPCAEHYAQVKAALGRAGLGFEEDQRLVRGLDYYTRTVYEFKHPGLGARDAIGGGGRYDGLVELLGGPPTPCVGFALGAEAILLAMEAEGAGSGAPAPAGPAAYVVCFEDEARAYCFELVQALRAAGVSADMDYEGRSAKAQMRTANRLGVRLSLLIGERELRAQEVLIRDMASSEQRSVPRAEAVEAVAAGLAAGAGQGRETDGRG